MLLVFFNFSHLIKPRILQDFEQNSDQKSSLFQLLRFCNSEKVLPSHGTQSQRCCQDYLAWPIFYVQVEQRASVCKYIRDVGAKGSGGPMPQFWQIR